MSSVDAPIQTNAADPEQVKEADDAQELARQQDSVDALAEIADKDARRRAYARLGALFHFAPDKSEYTDARTMMEVGRFLARHDTAVALLDRWKQHPRECAQMLMEGFAREASEGKGRRSKRR